MKRIYISLVIIIVATILILMIGLYSKNEYTIVSKYQLAEKSMYSVPIRNIGSLLNDFNNIQEENSVEFWKNNSVESVRFYLTSEGNSFSMSETECSKEFDKRNYPAVRNTQGEPISQCHITSASHVNNWAIVNCLCHYPIKIGDW